VGTAPSTQDVRIAIQRRPLSDYLGANHFRIRVFASDAAELLLLEGDPAVKGGEGVSEVVDLTPRTRPSGFHFLPAAGDRAALLALAFPEAKPLQISGKDLTRSAIAINHSALRAQHSLAVVP
jgi:hypothetical protein